MPLVNFQDWLAPKVYSGVKRQTLRAQRKHPFKEGQRLYLFTGSYYYRADDPSETRHPLEKIGEAVCSQVQTAWIFHHNPLPGTGQCFSLYLDEVMQGGDAHNGFAYADGFAGGWSEFEEWLTANHGRQSFNGQLVHWDEIILDPSGWHGLTPQRIWSPDT